MPYTPEVTSIDEIRSSVTPAISTSDATDSEILFKIESVESYVKVVYFGGGSLPVTSRIPVILLTMSNLLSNAILAKKYATLSSERLGDYSYTLSETKTGKESSSPLTIIKSWQKMAIEMLEKLATPSDYQVYVVNE